VDGPHELTAFITASKENGREGHVLASGPSKAPAVRWAIHRA
jgi:hypothetical protein